MTSELPVPTARRLMPPSWKDSRLLLGVLLVLGSVVLGATAVGAADDRVGVWAAREDMTPGDPVRAGDLVRIDVQLGTTADKYLVTDRDIPDGAVLDRSLRPGELVPRSALVTPGDLEYLPTPIHVEPVYLAGLTKGSRVRVYAAEPLTSEERQAGEQPTYVQVVDRATVHSLPEESSTVVGGSRSVSSVQLLIAEDDVERVLSLDSADSPLKIVAHGAVLPEDEG